MVYTFNGLFVWGGHLKTGYQKLNGFGDAWNLVFCGYFTHCAVNLATSTLRRSWDSLRPSDGSSTSFRKAFTSLPMMSIKTDEGAVAAVSNRRIEKQSGEEAGFFHLRQTPRRSGGRRYKGATSFATTSKAWFVERHRIYN